MDYEIVNLLSDRDLIDLRTNFERLPPKLWHQDYNLFDVDKRHPDGTDREHVPAYEKLRKYANKRTMSHYFLLYGPESFTRFHSDDDERVAMTIVTQIDTSDDLVGGKALVQLPYRKASRPSNKGARRSMDPVENDISPVGDIIVPRVVELKNGQSLVYDHKLRHGVSQVETGWRLVLISWFFKDEYKGGV